jgi:hypothetical protein
LKASRKSRVFRRSAEIPQTQGVPTPEVVAIHVSNVVSIQRGSELDALKKLSTLVYDTKHAANEAAALGPQAATVSPSVLLHLLSTNHGSDVGSIEGALVYEACAVENFAGYSEDVRHDCVLDKAFCNLAAMMASRVTGSVSVEVVEATNDADFICAKALRMRDMLLELGVDVGARVLFKIPCTWQGVLAVERLEQQGVKCHVTQVYCLVSISHLPHSADHQDKTDTFLVTIRSKPRRRRGRAPRWYRYVCISQIPPPYVPIQD